MTSGTGVRKRRKQGSASLSSLGEGYENAPPRLEKVVRLKVELLFDAVQNVELECERIGRTDEGCSIYKTSKIKIDGVGPMEYEQVIEEREMQGVTRIP